MGGEWRATTFADAVSIQRGHDLPEQARRAGTVPVVGSAGPNGWHNEALARGPGVVIGRSGASAGQVTYVRTDFWPHNTTLYVTDFRGNNPYYVFRLLGTLGLANHAGGSAQPSLNRNHLAQLPVRLPARPEQDSIAELLGALDDKIEMNRRTTEILEATARALFKSWFVNFDPVCGKAEGGTSDLPNFFGALFPDKLTNNGRPQSWITAPFNKIVEQDRTTIDPASLGETVVDHFSLPAFDAGRLAVTELAQTIKSLKLSVSAPVILFSKLNPDTPRIWAIHAQGPRPMLASTEFLALRPAAANIPFSFVESLLASDVFRAKASGMVTGTSKSHQRVQPAALLETEWLMPPPPVLAAFNEMAGPALNRRAGLVEESATLAALRDTLLPKLISGKLHIRHAERAVAAA